MTLEKNNQTNSERINELFERIKVLEDKIDTKKTLRWVQRQENG